MWINHGLGEKEVGSPPLLEGEGIAEINKDEDGGKWKRENEGKYPIY